VLNLYVHEREGSELNLSHRLQVILLVTLLVVTPLACQRSTDQDWLAERLDQATSATRISLPTGTAGVAGSAAEGTAVSPASPVPKDEQLPNDPEALNQAASRPTAATRFSPTPMPSSGSTAAINDSTFRFGSEPITPENANRLGKVWEIEAEEELTSLAWAPDSLSLAVASSTSVYRWPLGSDTPDVRAASTGSIVAEFSPDGELLLLIASPLALQLVAARDLSFVRELEGRLTVSETGNRSVTSKDMACFSPDASMVATPGGHDMSVWLWRVSDGSFEPLPVRKVELVEPVTPQQGVFSVAFSPDGRLLATGLSDGYVALFGVDNGLEIERYRAQGSGTSSVAFSPDGTILSTSSHEDEFVRLWRVEDGAFIRAIGGHGSAASLRFSPDGQILMTAARGGGIRLFRVADGSLLCSIAASIGFVRARPSFSPDGRYIATPGDEGTIAVYAVTDVAHQAPATESPAVEMETLYQMEVRAVERDGEGNITLVNLFLPEEYFMSLGGELTLECVLQPTGISVPCRPQWLQTGLPLRGRLLRVHFWDESARAMKFALWVSRLSSAGGKLPAEMVATAEVSED